MARTPSRPTVSLTSLSRSIAAQNERSQSASLPGQSNSGYQRLAASAPSLSLGGENSSTSGQPWPVAPPPVSMTANTKRPLGRDEGAAVACALDGDGTRVCARLDEASALLRRLVLVRLPPPPGRAWPSGVMEGILALGPDTTPTIGRLFDYYHALLDVARRVFKPGHPPLTREAEEADWQWLQQCAELDGALGLANRPAVAMALHVTAVAPDHAVRAALGADDDGIVAAASTEAMTRDLQAHADCPEMLKSVSTDSVVFLPTPGGATKGGDTRGTVAAVSARDLLGAPFDVWLALETAVLHIPIREIVRAVSSADACLAAHCSRHGGPPRRALRDARDRARAMLCELLAWLVDATRQVREALLGPASATAEASGDLDVFDCASDASTWPPRVRRLWLLVRARNTPEAARALAAAGPDTAGTPVALDSVPFVAEHVLPGLVRQYVARRVWLGVDPARVRLNKEGRFAGLNAYALDFQLFASHAIRNTVLPACRDIAHAALPPGYHHHHHHNYDAHADGDRPRSRDAVLTPEARARLLDRLRVGGSRTLALPPCIAHMLEHVAREAAAERNTASFGHGGRRALAGWILDLVDLSQPAALDEARELCDAFSSAAGLTPGRDAGARELLQLLQRTGSQRGRSNATTSAAAMSFGCAAVIGSTRDPAERAKRGDSLHVVLHCPYAIADPRATGLDCRRMCVRDVATRFGVTLPEKLALAPACPSEMLTAALAW